ncbi:MAG TPA: hypothetical protein VKV32_00420 [Stellaceae bacterium]|nr:hypothetical protein [Stellaceae bacterium]
MAEAPSLSAKITYLKSEDNRGDGDVLETLYEILGILDQKAIGLLTLDGLVIAIMTAFSQAQIEDLSLGATFVAVIVIIGFATAIFACLMIINVKWPFLDYIIPGATSGLRKELSELEKEVARRTNISWLRGGAILLRLDYPLLWR